MAKRKPEDPPKGAPAWTATFGDLMNLLLTFFVMLFSMSTIDSQKYDQMAASMTATFSIFSGGGSSLGDGVLISSGVSQLNNLGEYTSNMGASAEGDADEVTDSTSDTDSTEDAEQESMTEKGTAESEQLAEQIEEALEEQGMSADVDMNFTSQYVQLTLKGSLLFDSGSVDLKEASYPVLNQVCVILQKYASASVEIEGHTDNVPMSGSKYANNDELSDGRALSVFNYVIAHTTLDPANITHSGRGEYVPVADNSTPEGRAKNRRVVIKIYNSMSKY